MKQSRKRLRIRFAITVLSIITLLGCGFCITSFYSGLGEIGCPETDVTRIENIARFRLPPSARNLWSFCSGMQGWSAYARFEMLPSDLDTLVSNTFLQEPLSRTNKPERPIANDIEGFSELSMTSFLYGIYDTEEFDQEVFIDTSAPANYIVYVSVVGG